MNMFFFFYSAKKKKMLPISKSNNISCYFKLRLTRKKRLFVITPLLNIKKKKLIFLCTIFKYLLFIDTTIF